MRGAVEFLSPAHRAGVGDAAELAGDRVLEILADLDGLIQFEILRRLRVHKCVRFNLPRIVFLVIRVTMEYVIIPVFSATAGTGSQTPAYRRHNRQQLQ